MNKLRSSKKACVKLCLKHLYLVSYCTMAKYGVIIAVVIVSACKAQPYKFLSYHCSHKVLDDILLFMIFSLDGDFINYIFNILLQVEKCYSWNLQT